jgi:hypothetical protein
LVRGGAVETGVLAVGIDPGVTTGVAVVDEDGTLVDHGEVRTPFEMWEFLHKVMPSYIVIEKFVGRMPPGTDMYATTVCKLFVDIYKEFCELEFQLPNVRGRDSEIRGSVHERDAHGHLISWLQRRRPGGR